MGHSNPAAQKAANASGKKEVISDAEYIKRLRVDVASNCYPSCEGTHALLREYDIALVQIDGGLHLKKRVAELEEDLARMTRGRDALQKDLERVNGDLNILRLQYEALKNGNSTDAPESLSEQLQAELEPLPAEPTLNAEEVARENA
jgi:hypothetical protein